MVNAIQSSCCPFSVERRLCSLPLFSGMSSDGLAELLRMSKITAYASGQRLFDLGDSPRALYILLDGRIRITSAGGGADDDFIGWVEPVDMLLLESAFNRRPYAVAADATDDAWLLEIPLKALVSRLRADPDFATAMLVRLADRTHLLFEENAVLGGALERQIHSKRGDRLAW
jgi:CRP-like cAMP-binding protein